MTTVLERRPVHRHRLADHPRPPAAIEEQAVSAERPHRVARALKWLGSAVATVVMVTLFLAQGALGVLPYRTSYVLTGSMTPTMPIGSLVVTKRINASDVHVGDVITFNDPRQSGREVTHRIFKIESTEQGAVIVTKGDANTEPDPWRVRQRGRLWLAVTSVPKLGYPFAWLGATWVRLGGTLIPAFALGGWAIRAIWKSDGDGPHPQGRGQRTEREGSGLS